MSFIQKLLDEKIKNDACIAAAIEFGYKMCEKGHNLDYAILEFAKQHAETIKEKIDSIIASQYSNYQGRAHQRLRPLHNTIRNAIGDELFLQYLLKQMTENPRPVYQPEFKQREFLS